MAEIWVHLQNVRHRKSRPQKVRDERSGQGPATEGPKYKRSGVLKVRLQKFCTKNKIQFHDIE